MKTFKFALIVLFAALFACDGNNTFKQLDTDFTDNRWQRNDTKTYEFTIDEPGAYDLHLLFGFVAGMQFAQIPVVFEWIRPDGIGASKSIIILTKNADGQDLGDCAGDLCDLEQTVFKGQVLTPGKYTVRLSNAFEHEFLPNVTGVGIRINKNGK